MRFWGNKHAVENRALLLNSYIECFGNPASVFQSTWNGQEYEEVEIDEAKKARKNRFFLLEFAPSPERPVWTYITLGMAEKKMANGTRAELIWQNREKSEEILELLIGFVHYPFVSKTSLDYGHTITNADPASAFSMNALLIAPPILDAEFAEELLTVLSGQDKELFWLLPIHNEEKMFIQESGDFTKLFDMWLEHDIGLEFLCDPNRTSTV